MLKKIYKLSLGVAILGILSCSTKVEERIPGVETVEFPYSMSLQGNVLVISATSTDGRYDHGRLLNLDTQTIKTSISGNEEKAPIPFKKVVLSNILTPRDVGKIVMSKDAITFTERQSGSLLSIPAGESGMMCKDPFLRAEKCPGAAQISFFANEAEQDTSGLAAIKTSDAMDTFLVSYKSSNLIDVVNLDKKAGKLAFKKVKQFSSLDLLGTTDAKNLKKRRFITKAMAVSGLNSNETRAYFLFESHPEKNLGVKSPKASYLASIKVDDLMTGSFTKAKVYELKKLFNIHGVKDLFIDETNDQALILASSPSAIFKIDLKQNTLLRTSLVCPNAAQMAVNKNMELIVIPCIKENQITSYSYTGMELLTASDVVGHFPAYVVIDEAHRLIYCTYYLSGILGIFDDNLKYLGHIFDKVKNQGLGL